MSQNGQKSHVFYGRDDKTLYLIPLLIIMNACSLISGNQKNKYQGWETQLKNYQEKWESQHITHYKMAIIIPYSSGGLGSLPGPLLVEVKDNSVISVIDAHGVKQVLTDWMDDYDYQNYFTVTGLFSYISQYYSKNPPEMEVSYDSTLGYPNRIHIDPYVEPCCQELIIEIRDFKMLP